MIFASVLVEKPDVHIPEWSAEGLVVDIWRRQTAGPAELGYTIAVQERYFARPMLPHEFVIPALIRRRHRSPAEHHKAQTGKIRTFDLWQLHPPLKHGADREEEGYTVMGYGLMEPWIEHTARSERHGRAHGKGDMHLVYDAVSIRQIDDHRCREIVPWQLDALDALDLKEARRRSVEGRVGERDRLSGTAGGAGGVQYKGGIAAVLGGIRDRLTAVGCQQLAHADWPVQSLQVLELSLLHRRRHGMDRDPRHRHMKHDYVVQSQCLSLHEKVVYEIGLGKVVRDDKVRQALAAYSLRDLLCEKGAVGRHQRHVRAYHIQPIDREYGLRAGRAEKADAGTVLARHAERRKHRGIALPLPEHKPIGVLSAAVLQSSSVQVADICVGHVTNIFPRLLALPDTLSALYLRGNTVVTHVFRFLCICNINVMSVPL